jgi:two-component system, chemotaxis family, response regulator PixG
MTRAIVELYRNLVARGRSHRLKQPDPEMSIATTSRLSRLLVSYSQKQFTGSIKIDAPSGQKWNIHYRLGRTIWASGGCHPLRRWRRSLQQSGAVVDFQELDWSARSSPDTPWEYHLLAIAVEQKHLTRQQAKSIIFQIVRDAMFDILQEETKHSLEYRLHSEEAIGNVSILLKSESVLWQVIQDWQAWCRADLKDYSPNHAPRLRKPERFARVLSPASYQKMENLMSGRYSLRDLAVQLDRDLIAFTQSLMPYLRQEAIELIEIPDEPMGWVM